MFTAPDTDPSVTPTTTLQASGTWASILALLAALPQLLGLVTLPAPWDKIVVVVAAVAGFILNRLSQSSYRPKPPAPPA